MRLRNMKTKPGTNREMRISTATGTGFSRRLKQTLL